MQNTYYMDYQATSPCDPRVLEKMLPYFCENFGNSHSSSHIVGKIAAEAIEDARSQIADLMGTSDPREIIFTSGATESCNLAIQGVARFYKEKGNRIITTNIEHKCTLEAFNSLGYEGFDPVFVPVKSNGIIDLEALKNAINDKTTLVSIIVANNEIGVIQPIEEISKICRERGVFLHLDAAQAFGKIKVDASLADLISVSAHKIYGPKGIGALYIRLNPRVRLKPLTYGGGQERGIRPGTLPTPLCVGFGEACRIAKKEMEFEHSRLSELSRRFIQKIQNNLPKAFLNGDPVHRIPGCINMCFEGVEGESIMLGMPEVCVSSGSACASSTLEPSHVLRAISEREDIAHMSLRIGLGRFTTLQEVDYVALRIVEVVTHLREMSPLWP